LAVIIRRRLPVDSIDEVMKPATSKGFRMIGEICRQGKAFSGIYYKIIQKNAFENIIHI